MSIQPDWILLEYGSEEQLDKALVSREGRLLFYPAVGRMSQDGLVDLQITIEGSNVLFPMGARVVELRERPRGPEEPRGVVLEVIEADRSRFDRLCAYVDGVWKPGVRRSEPRYPAVVRASYYLSSKYQPAETVNLSCRGMLLRTDGPLPTSGQGVFVRLHPALALRPIGFDARVCWLDEVESRRGMGLLCTGPEKSLRKLDSLVTRIMKHVKM